MLRAIAEQGVLCLKAFQRGEALPAPESIYRDAKEAYDDLYAFLKANWAREEAERAAAARGPASAESAAP